MRRVVGTVEDNKEDVAAEWEGGKIAERKVRRRLAGVTVQKGLLPAVKWSECGVWRNKSLLGTQSEHLSYKCITKKKVMLAEKNRWGENTIGRGSVLQGVDRNLSGAHEASVRYHQAFSAVEGSRTFLTTIIFHMFLDQTLHFVLSESSRVRGSPYTVPPARSSSLLPHFQSCISFSCCHEKWLQNHEGMMKKRNP